MTKFSSKVNKCNVKCQIEWEFDSTWKKLVKMCRLFTCFPCVSESLSVFIIHWNDFVYTVERLFFFGWTKSFIYTVNRDVFRSCSHSEQRREYIIIIFASYMIKCVWCVVVVDCLSDRLFSTHAHSRGGTSYYKLHTKSNSRLPCDSIQITCVYLCVAIYFAVLK